MSLLRKSSLALSLLAACAIPAFASITVYSPANDAAVSQQFTLTAVASSCSNQPVSAMGFSLDSSSSTTVVKSTSIDATVSAASGNHTLHVKAWGNAGASCMSNVTINVGARSTATTGTLTTASGSTLQGIAVASPAGNATVYSPFVLNASAGYCSSQAVTAMGFSLDNSSNTAIVDNTTVSASVAASAGAHTLHVKSWGNS
ncbi:MAG: hypothetical protein ACLGSH_13545 [Acidobacteriota bacterium]